MIESKNHQNVALTRIKEILIDIYNKVLLFKNNAAYCVALFILNITQNLKKYLIDSL